MYMPGTYPKNSEFTKILYSVSIAIFQPSAPSQITVYFYSFIRVDLAHLNYCLINDSNFHIWLVCTIEFKYAIAIINIVFSKTSALEKPYLNW